jgi:hypothetical protein
MSTTRDRRRALRRAESRLFEGVLAHDEGDLRLADALLRRATTPRRARPTILETERRAITR